MGHLTCRGKEEAPSQSDGHLPDIADSIDFLYEIVGRILQCDTGVVKLYHQANGSSQVSSRRGTALPASPGHIAPSDSPLKSNFTKDFSPTKASLVTSGIPTRLLKTTVENQTHQNMQSYRDLRI